MVSFTGRAATPTRVLVRFLDRESVLLYLETEQYFGFDETGTRMCQACDGFPEHRRGLPEASRGIRPRTGIVGIRKEKEKFEAHASVECDGATLNEPDEHHHRYSLLD